MSAKSNQKLKILSFLGAALFVFPSMAAEVSVGQFLDLTKYELALKKIDQATEATLVEELTEYMQSHSVAPHTALSRMSEEKIREFVFGGEVSRESTHAAAQKENPTRLKLQLDPLKEKARLKIQGALYGQIEVSPSQHVVSLDIFENVDSQMKLQYQHLSTPLGKQDQLQFRWHF